MENIGELSDDERLEWEVNEKLNYERHLAYAEEEGIRQGIEKGFKQGVKRGTEDKTKEIVIGMLRERIDNEIISKVTGKPIEKIKERERYLNNIRKIYGDKSDEPFVWGIDEALRYQSNIERAREQGIEKGIKKGIERGIKRSTEDRTREIIINMLKEEIDNEIISKVTGKPIEEIIEIKKYPDSIRELNDDERVVKPSTWEWLERQRYHDDLAYAKEQGIEEVIINMLNKKMDYNTISDVTGKTLEEIKELEEAI